MDPYNKNIFYHTSKNNSRYDDEFLDDQLEFEDELNNMDKINKSFLNSESNNQDLIPEDNGIDGLLNMCFNPENNESIKTLKLNNKDLRQSVSIPRSADTINVIYLEIELEENMTFYELTNFERQQLFETMFELTIGGQSIMSSTILTNLFMMFSQDINIKLEGNKFQIPLIDFNMTKIGTYTKNINLKDYEYGLPHVALAYHEIRINLEFVTKELFKFMKFNIKVCQRYLESAIRRTLAQVGHEYLFLMSQCESSTNLDVISLNYNFGAKVIILYFIPLNDDYIDYPKIDSIEIQKDDITYLCDSSELLKMELYDICYTVIPITDDFSSWKNINRTLKNPDKYLSSISVPFKNTFKMYINYESKPDNFEIIYNVITPNIYRIMSGMGGFAFCN